MKIPKFLRMDMVPWYVTEIHDCEVIGLRPGIIFFGSRIPCVRNILKTILASFIKSTG